MSPGGKKTGKGFALCSEGDVFGGGVGIDNFYTLPVTWIVEEVDRKVLRKGEGERGP